MSDEEFGAVKLQIDDDGEFVIVNIFDAEKSVVIYRVHLEPEWARIVAQQLTMASWKVEDKSDN